MCRHAGLRPAPRLCRRSLYRLRLQASRDAIAGALVGEAIGNELSLARQQNRHCQSPRKAARYFSRKAGACCRISVLRPHALRRATVDRLPTRHGGDAAVPPDRRGSRNSQPVGGRLRPPSHQPPMRLDWGSGRAPSVFCSLRLSRVFVEATLYRTTTMQLHSPKQPEKVPPCLRCSRKLPM